ncbi:hypothetical protein IMZ29_02420 [Achromobacter sp. GG226]|uniref:hypothetical protein n=1 Tax=Verticiella alkaliphila TaxID=2779529 RepID=UPI001C0D5923|nr:hypothetical protein [Verticiella sp. GG226]MBU4609441.1 hypothetical protein [Verticiella sp. GG226]
MTFDWADYNNVPPAIPLLLSEVVDKADDPSEALRILRLVYKEIAEQSRSFLSQNNEIEQAAPQKLAVYADGALNLLDGTVGCFDLACRLKAAKNFGRSFGLVADEVWVTDYVTEKFLIDGPPSEATLLRIVSDALILKELAPLISHGIIRFRSPWRSVCSSCQEEFVATIDEMTAHAERVFASNFSLENLKGGEYALHTGNSYYPPMVLRVLPSRWLGAARIETPEETRRRTIQKAIRSALWSIDEANRGAGIVFSNSSIAMASLAMQENQLTNREDVKLFDANRAMEIPWVSDLSISQLVELRAEVQSALPAFRQAFSSHYSSDRKDQSEKSQFMEEMKSQAIEVRNELENVRKFSSRYWRSSYSILGLGISAYGLGSGNNELAMTGLLPILQLISDHKHHANQDIDKLKRRPGYVLVKAQDILLHA